VRKKLRLPQRQSGRRVHVSDVTRVVRRRDAALALAPSRHQAKAMQEQHKVCSCRRRCRRRGEKEELVMKKTKKMEATDTMVLKPTSTMVSSRNLSFPENNVDPLDVVGAGPALGTRLAPRAIAAAAAAAAVARDVTIVAVAVARGAHRLKGAHRPRRRREMWPAKHHQCHHPQQQTPRLSRVRLQRRQEGGGLPRTRR
jgi:hypothetical protein